MSIFEIKKTKPEDLKESFGENQGEQTQEQAPEQTKTERKKIKAEQKAKLEKRKEQLKGEIKRYKNDGLKRKEAKIAAEERLKEGEKDPEKMERVEYFEDLIQKKTGENRCARIQQEVRKSANIIKDVFLRKAKENRRQIVNERGVNILYKSPDGRIISVFVDEPLKEDTCNLTLNEYNKGEEEKIEQLDSFIIGVDLHSSPRTGVEIKGKRGQYETNGKFTILKGKKDVLTDEGPNVENLARALELSEYTRENLADFEELDFRGLKQKE